jgi:hypothetical protein
MHKFRGELLRLRAEFDALRQEHEWRSLRSAAEERAHLDRFNRWIADVEEFRLAYLARHVPVCAR